MRLDQWKAIFLLGMVLSVSACSSSQPKEGDGAEGSDVVLPSADAGTDAVPSLGRRSAGGISRLSG
jgi:hypothetical protein